MPTATTVPLSDIQLSTVRGHARSMQQCMWASMQHARVPVDINAACNSACGHRCSMQQCMWTLMQHATVRVDINAACNRACGHQCSMQQMYVALSYSLHSSTGAGCAAGNSACDSYGGVNSSLLYVQYTTILCQKVCVAVV